MGLNQFRNKFRNNFNGKNRMKIMGLRICKRLNLCQFQPLCGSQVIEPGLLG